MASGPLTALDPICFIGESILIHHVQADMGELSAFKVYRSLQKIIQPTYVKTMAEIINGCKIVKHEFGEDTHEDRFIIYVRPRIQISYFEKEIGTNFKLHDPRYKVLPTPETLARDFAYRSLETLWGKDKPVKTYGLKIDNLKFGSFNKKQGIQIPGFSEWFLENVHENYKEEIYPIWEARCAELTEEITQFDEASKDKKNQILIKKAQEEVKCVLKKYRQVPDSLLQEAINEATIELVLDV